MLFRVVLMLIVSSLICAAPASAGLGIGAPTTYTPGDIITLTLTGDSEGNLGDFIRSVLTVDPDLISMSGSPGVLQDSNPSFLWAQTSAVGTCGGDGLAENECLALDAFAYIFEPVPIDLLPSTLSTFSFDTTGAMGDLVFSLDPDGAGFFGLPGTSAVVALIPEPSTGALMATGMLALAASRRRRGRRSPPTMGTSKEVLRRRRAAGWSSRSCSRPPALVPTRTPLRIEGAPPYPCGSKALLAELLEPGLPDCRARARFRVHPELRRTRMSCRRMVALSAVLFFPSTALAGLRIDAPASFTPGDLVVITLSGDSEGETGFIIRALLTVNPGLNVADSLVGTLNDSFPSPSQLWVQTSTAGTCGGGSLAGNECVGVDAYIDQFLQQGIDLLPSTLSTFTFDTTGAMGDLVFSLDPDGAGFFGLPGTSAVVAFVPEPATALLLALGLAALAGAHRRRS